jgi:hypothetical protein
MLKIGAMELLTLEVQSKKKEIKERRKKRKLELPSRNTWFVSLFIIIVSACIFILSFMIIDIFVLLLQ